MNFDKDFPLTSCLVEMQKMQSKIDSQQARIDALEKTLKYYSDLPNWHEDADNSVMDDIGKIAQDALDQLKKDL